jgi:hypothetical protein
MFMVLCNIILKLDFKKRAVKLVNRERKVCFIKDIEKQGFYGFGKKYIETQGYKRGK